MKLLDKIDIDLTKPFICTLGSLAAVGKTTFLAILACELINNGKTILFVTDDEKSVIKKIYSINVINNTRSVIIQQTEGRTLKSMIGDRKFDIIIIDSHFMNNKQMLDETFDYIQSEKLPTFISTELKRLSYNHAGIIDFNPSKIIFASTHILTISRKESFSFFERLKQFLFFIKKPNISVDLIKNRFGKLKRFNFFIDFNDLKNNISYNKNK